MLIPIVDYLNYPEEIGLVHCKRQMYHADIFIAIVGRNKMHDIGQLCHIDSEFEIYFPL